MTRLIRSLRGSVIFLVLLAVSALFLFPFYWVVVSSLESVSGLDLQPPSLYPAELQTVAISVPVQGRMFIVERTPWLKLADSVDLLASGPGSGSGPAGAYYLAVEHGKPTQRVKWFPAAAVQAGATGPAAITFPKAAINQMGGHRVAVLAKLVKSTSTGFDELLFAVPKTAKSLDQLAATKNAPHTELRSFAPQWGNYAKALKGPEASIGGASNGFLVFLRNSAFLASMAVLGQVLVSSLVAFGFARLHFKGREALFVLLIATLMIPAQVTLIPLFTIYKSLGWIDTFWPLIVPNFTAGAFNVFLIRQFMLGFPRELDESAALDGASPFRIFRSIIFPNCTPVLIVVGLFTFVGSWQDVMGPLIYLDRPEFRTVSLGLEYFRSPYVDNRPLLMAGAVLSMLPVACLFLIAQRYILSGIVTTGLK